MTREAHCPTCGYTKKDASIHMDHHLCSNKNPPWGGAGDEEHERTARLVAREVAMKSVDQERLRIYRRAILNLCGGDDHKRLEAINTATNDVLAQLKETTS